MPDTEPPVPETCLTARPSERVREIDSVGIVGWGRMGGQIGRWLIARGRDVIATDPSPDADESMRTAGVRSCRSVADVAAAADLVLVVVVDDAQVRDVLLGERGAVDAARPGTVIAICSSVRPDTCADAAAAARVAGVEVIDVALVGGERAAEHGELTLMCGGERAALDRCVDAFSAFAKDVCHIGPLGAGQVAKTANNILLWSCLRADVEALRLAKAFGVAPAQLRAVLNAGTGANRPLADWGMHRLRWPKKDLDTAVALAGEAGVQMPLVEALRPLIAELTKDDLDALR